MKESEIFSWIFLAIGLSNEPVDVNGISMIADGINHAVPTEKEMQNSLKWLAQNNYLIKDQKKYFLSETGKKEIQLCKSRSKNIMEMWKELELQILIN